MSGFRPIKIYDGKIQDIGGGGGGGGQFVDPVIDFFDPTGGLPVGPSPNDRYIASATANGWTDQYIYTWNGASWDEYVPVAGDEALVLNLGQVYLFDGATWGAAVLAQRPAQVIEVSDSFTANDTFNQYPTMAEALARAAVLGPSLIRVYPRSTGNYDSPQITDAHAGCVIECDSGVRQTDTDFTGVIVSFTVETNQVTFRNARIDSATVNNGLANFDRCQIAARPTAGGAIFVGQEFPFGTSDLDKDVGVFFNDCVVGFAQGGNPLVLAKLPVWGGTYLPRRQTTIFAANTTFQAFGGAVLISGAMDQARLNSSQTWLYLLNCTLAWPAVPGTYKIVWPDPTLNDYVTYNGRFQGVIQGTLVEESTIDKPTNLPDLGQILFINDKDQAEGLTQTAYPPVGSTVGNVQQAISDLHADDIRIEATANRAENGVAILATAFEIDSDLIVGQLDGLINERFQDLNAVDQPNSKNFLQRELLGRVQLGRNELVDSFEGYADSAALQAAWVKAGPPAAITEYLETTVVWKGTKSMRLEYTVGIAPGTSRVTRTFGTPRNWDDADEMQLHMFNGNPAVRFYIELSDGVNTIQSPFFGNSLVSQWEFIRIERATFTAGTPGPFDWTNVASIAIVFANTVKVNSDVYFDNIYLIGDRPWTQRLNIDPFTVNNWVGAGLTTGVSGGNLQLGLSGVAGSASQAIAVDMAQDSALGMAVWWSGVSVPGSVDLRLRLTDSVGRKVTTRPGWFEIPTFLWPTTQAKARRIAWTMRAFDNTPNGDLYFSFSAITNIEILVGAASPDPIPTGTLNIRLFDSGDAGRLQLYPYAIDPNPRPTQIKTHLAYVAHVNNRFSVDSSFDGLDWEWVAPNGVNAPTVVGVAEYTAIVGGAGKTGAFRKLGEWAEDLSSVAWGNITTRICHFGFMEIEGISQLFRRIL